jgi:septal ring factor EnvC (AmiA/AmiB activator)
MLRKIIAGTAVAGALTLGIAGAAGAATPAPSTGNSGAKAVLCADLPQIQSKLQDLQNTVNNTWIPKLQAAETKAKDANHTTLADKIATRITAIENRESKVNARLAKLEAKCQAAPTDSSGNTASTNG